MFSFSGCPLKSLFEKKYSSKFCSFTLVLHLTIRCSLFISFCAASSNRRSAISFCSYHGEYNFEQQARYVKLLIESLDLNTTKNTTTNTMNNNVDFLLLQRLRAARAAQIGFHAAADAPGNQLLYPKKAMVGNLDDRFPLSRQPLALHFAAPPKPHGILQAINNELAATSAAKQEKLLLIKVLAANAAEQERLSTGSSHHELALLNEHVVRQKMSVQNTQRQLLNLNSQRNMLLNDQRYAARHTMFILSSHRVSTNRRQFHEPLQLDQFARLQHQAAIADSGCSKNRPFGVYEAIKVTSAPREKEDGGKESTIMPTKRKQRVVGNKWRIQYSRLIEYKAEYGNCVVPRGFLLNPRLASWVAEQRKQYKLFNEDKDTSMTQHRVDLLNEIDFVWNAHEAAWQKNLSALIAFKKKYGCWMVPVDQHQKLGLWVKEQKRHHNLMKRGKASHMTAERVRLLEEAGFSFYRRASMWDETLKKICQNCVSTRGDGNVPRDYRGRLGVMG